MSSMQNSTKEYDKNAPAPFTQPPNKQRYEKIHEAMPQIIAVSIKNVLLMGYGMTLGFPTILIPALQGGNPDELIILNSDQISWISSINLICVPLGCLLSGIITQPLGRKLSMQLINLPFIVAWIILYCSNNVYHLYAALALTGFAGGVMEAPVITYVAEITQPHLRGMLSATSSMTIIFGVFSQFLLGTFFTWRWQALFNLFIPALATLLLFIVPESPHWLILRGKKNGAKKALAWLRGWSTIEAIENEFKELCLQLKVDKPTDKQNKLNFIKLFASRGFILPYILVSFTFFLGAFSGMHTLQIYAVQIFQTFKSPIDKYYATMLLGIVELIGSLVCVLTIHRFGKRPLTFISTFGIAFCNIVVASYAYLINVKTLATFHSNFNQTMNITTNTNVTILGINAEDLYWLPTFLLIAIAFLSHLAIRLLPWVLIGEVYPANIRAIASGLSGGMGYIFGFISSKIYLSMIGALTLPGIFWLYGLVSLLGAMILFFVLPETEGRTLHDIQMHFLGVQKIKRKDGVFKTRKLKGNEENGQINHAFSEKTIVSDEIMNSRL